jgi:uncharacterized membrane protein YfcA
MGWLAAAFFITALLYASVGFGGGSTYTALLNLAGINFRLIPILSPICNIIVVTGGAIRYSGAGLMPWRRLMPLVIMSIPMAFLGGLTPIKEPTFMLILALGLLVAGLTLLFQPVSRDPLVQSERNKLARAGDLFASAGIGYLSGLVGLGGGIFLAPYLHFVRWADPREIAATSSAFILFNSLAGLAGQLLKLNAAGGLPDVVGYWPLALAVFAGGQIGSILGIRAFSPLMIRRATAVLILYVAGSLVWKLASA